MTINTNKHLKNGTLNFLSRAEKPAENHQILSEFHFFSSYNNCDEHSNLAMDLPQPDMVCARTKRSNPNMLYGEQP